MVLSYKVIKSKKQYYAYSKKLEELVTAGSAGKENKDEIELLTLLIEKWDEAHNSFDTLDPVTVLRSLMNDHNLKSRDLVDILGVSKGLISDILNYRKGMSKQIIRVLSAYFKLSQEAFNRPYKLKMKKNKLLVTRSEEHTV